MVVMGMNVEMVVVDMNKKDGKINKNRENNLWLNGNTHFLLLLHQRQISYFDKNYKEENELS